MGETSQLQKSLYKNLDIQIKTSNKKTLKPQKKMSEDKSDKKPEGVEHVNLKVCGQDGSVVQFKIKKNTQLKKLMNAYCDRQGLDINQIRFRFDGTPINETDSPASLDMEDDDTIDVFTQQTGGF